MYIIIVVLAFMCSTIWLINANYLLSLLWFLIGTLWCLDILINSTIEKKKTKDRDKSKDELD